MSEFDPRFGGKYRTVLRSAAPDTISELRSRFTRHIVSGYLLPGYAIECGAQQPLRRHPDMRDKANLFGQWVPLIFSAAGAPEFDGDMVVLYGKEQYAAMKHLWAQPFGQLIADCLARLNIPLGEEERRMIANYFNAGLVLRVVEANPLSEEENADVVTGGGYSLLGSGGERQEPIPAQSGCLLVVLAASLYIALVYALS